MPGYLAFVCLATWHMGRGKEGIKAGVMTVAAIVAGLASVVVLGAVAWERAVDREWLGVVTLLVVTLAMAFVAPLATRRVLASRGRSR